MSSEPPDLETHNRREASHAPDRYSEWMRVNCVIDPRDDIFHFFASHAIAANPVREYLADGWRTLSELLLLLESMDQPLTKVRSMLEFAAGFGRFTRHLAPVLPGRVTVSDVHPGSVDFLKEQLGVEGFYSTADPAALRIPARYDLVFVLSMFTHLPPARWGAWLRALFAAVEPGGLLVFSVHQEKVPGHDIAYGPDGTLFIASSESRELGADQYGTTFTTRAWVESEVRRALGRPPTAYRETCFWNGQDAVVVRRQGI
ncbi:MAG TPA: class I SAM-dependent methyltransferase [Usitatibacter sp.]|nr:class I SAM-dependent methyltransferase [Usitatibacter sp.]